MRPAFFNEDRTVLQRGGFVIKFDFAYGQSFSLECQGQLHPFAAARDDIEPGIHMQTIFKSFRLIKRGVDDPLLIHAFVQIVGLRRATVFFRQLPKTLKLRVIKIEACRLLHVRRLLAVIRHDDRVRSGIGHVLCRKS